MNNKDTPPNLRRVNYEVANGDTGKKKESEAYNGDSINRASSKLGINIMNIAHGEDNSNFEDAIEASNYRSHEQAGNEEHLHNSFEGIPSGEIKFKRVKHNGFYCPLHPQQVGTWITMTILVLTYYLFLVPGTLYIGEVYLAIIIIVYALLLIGVFIFCLRATAIDPTDRNVIYERECRREGKEAVENDELEYFCDVCEAYVHDRTKHCGDCNR
jgi:hypothetical protein